MILIVSGAVDAGKTTRMRALHRNMGGDGLLAVKIFDGDTFLGYRIERVTTGESMDLALCAEKVPDDWIEETRLGRFSFSRNAFEWGWSILAELVVEKVSPIFIDEAGPLELAGRGWASAIRDCLRIGCDTVISVRSHCVEQFISEYAIGAHELLNIDKE